MPKRRKSYPVALRCGVPYTAGLTNACTSTSNAPHTFHRNGNRYTTHRLISLRYQQFDGLLTARMPSPLIFINTLTLPQPNLFLWYAKCGNYNFYHLQIVKTVSTICSNNFGPYHTFFCNMAYNKYRQMVSFCVLL